ncbi:TraR/DksA C4-type zinc finger protein [Clostridium bowmanii]|uniref:TraR/DksA C4-type zinc finger protein n=1 Tax=Clostridium bowmanii TaxID=132925 RepID=UPI001C0AF47A|nr:TraR/DksA C4-type zinc finger protein [Clostridium bowmanii]MBU3190535.1 TraR/DksA C4-type zinc finger protein [Clostridium bowmanii]MCA1075066.1 TraR/DksA C4-type zinc finger protein [Clostridium bowmanii]
MDKDKLEYFKNKLINEQQRVNQIIVQMKQNGVGNSNSEMATELSFSDNHPSDTATELFDMEKGLALKQNEFTIMRKIRDALKSIEDNTYGKCKCCGKDIIEPRLEFIPYAENCVRCENDLNDKKPAPQNDRCVEEDVLGIPFRYSSSGAEVGIEAEDTFMVVDRFNELDDIIEYYDDDDEGGYVESIEKISNQQYKNQLPD